jgi:hypothetical protein
MTPKELDAAAKKLYDAGGSRASHPAWEQLGDVTKGVWKEKVCPPSTKLPAKRVKK